MSRTKAAELAADGHIQLDGRAAGKSDRVTAGAWLEATLPDPVSEDAPAVVPREVPGLAIIHDDTEIVVVDKPAGCAAHPSVGWDGPDVVSGLAAEGYRISTSGAAERQGIVQRLDVGTTGLMVVAKSERAYTVLKKAFRDRTVDKRYHTLVQGLPDPLVGTEYYRPSERGHERELKKRLDWFVAQRARAWIDRGDARAGGAASTSRPALRRPRRG